MKSDIRICFVCDGYPPERKVGGIESFTQTLAYGLVKRGHYVSVVGYSDRVSKLTIDNDRGVRIVRIPHLLKGLVPRMISERLRLESVIRQEIRISKINLVETPDVRGWLMFGSFGIPLIVRMHGANFVYFSNSARKVSTISRFFEKRTLKLATHLIAVSDYIRQETLSKAQLGDRSCELIYNGVDTNFFKPDSIIKQEKDSILFVGRLSQTKGAPNLFKALPAVFSAHPSARLYFIGKDPINHLGEQASAALINGLPEQFRSRVKICGETSREKLPEMYRKASVVVFPSMVEAHPIAVLEAMACECPTVFMRSGPGPEMIKHGLEGLLCDTLDPDKIADAVIAMLNNPARAREMGRAARERVQKQFSMPQFLDKNELYYRTILTLPS